MQMIPFALSLSKGAAVVRQAFDRAHAEVSPRAAASLGFPRQVSTSLSIGMEGLLSDINSSFASLGLAAILLGILILIIDKLSGEDNQPLREYVWRNDSVCIWLFPSGHCEPRIEIRDKLREAILVGQGNEIASSLSLH